MYRAMIIWIRNCFGFSRSESNAYLVLIALLISIHICLTRLPSMLGSSLEPQYLDSLVMALSSHQDTIPADPAYKAFDPNLIPFDSLLGMQVPRFIASNMIKYRQAGGRFTQPEDLLKLYGMTDSLWQELKPWIRVETSKPQITGSSAQLRYPEYKSPRRSTFASGQAAATVDLNRVDSVWLTGIRGIGQVLSARIIKYRKLLGGFHSTEQLTEVYHLPVEVIDKLKEKVIIDTTLTPLDKIQVNHTDYLQMASHPYLSYNQARAIVSYRNQHGSFSSLEDLKKIHLMDDSTYLRVRPYLDF